MRTFTVILFMGALVSVALLMFCLGRESVRQDAIRHGAAHYELNTNNEAEFRWGAKP